MRGREEYYNRTERRINLLTEKDERLEYFYYFLSEVSLTTVYNYLLIVSRFLQLNTSFNLNSCTKFIQASKRTSTGKESTGAYRANVYHALKRYGEFLVANGDIKENPMDKIKRPSSKDNQTTILKREESRLTQREVKDMTAGLVAMKDKNEIWGSRNLAIFLIFVNTGIRCSALYKLDVNDVNFVRNTITITDKESLVRTLTLTSNTVTVLKQWLEHRQALLIKANKRSDALFISTRMNRMGNDAIVHVIKLYGYKFTGKNISPHKLRATFGTLLYEKTGDIYFVQQCMGHSNPSTTELYIRGQNKWSQKASDIMGDILS